MKETPIFKGPLPESTDPPDGAAQISAAVEWVEELLAKIEELIDGAPAPGNLIVVNGTSDPVYRAITGDVGFNSLGVATIGEERVATTMIKNLAVTAAKLAEEAVETAKIKNLHVTEGKLANLAVAAGKLASEAVETGKIKALAVTEAKLAAESVSTAKLKNGAVTPEKFGTIPSCKAIRRTALAVAELGTSKIEWLEEEYDTSAMHSLVEKKDRLVAPIAGKYRITAYVNWVSKNVAAIHQRGLSIALNEATGLIDHRMVVPANCGFGFGQNVTLEAQLAANDFIQVSITSTNATEIGPMTALVGPHFCAMTWLGP